MLLRKKRVLSRLAKPVVKEISCKVVLAGLYQIGVCTKSSLFL